MIQSMRAMARGSSAYILSAAVSSLMAVRAYAQSSAAPSWSEHLDVVNALIALLLGYAIWSVKIMRDELREVIKSHEGRIFSVERDLNILYGEHRAEAASVEHRVK